jgi:hypothetical protein
MIEEIITPDSYVELKHFDLENRKSNELLAYDKAEYDHRWVVFNFIYNTEPEMIESLFMENIEEVQRKVFC